MPKQSIYHFVLPSQYWLTSTFIRFQELYESPRFRDQPFSLEEFQDWYVTTRDDGEFSYYTDWGGFNFPSYVADRFRRREMDPKSRKEQWVLDQLPPHGEHYYVIGTFQGGAGGIISHEVVHGLFYLHPAYADAVTDVVKEHALDHLKQALRDMGYCEAVLIDEINAYLTTGLSTNLRGKDWKAVRRCRPRLLRLFREHFGFDISKKAQAEAFIQDNIHHIDGSPVTGKSEPAPTPDT